MVERFEVIVPVRVDLAGGWTDVNPYCTDFGGEVVNFTINKYIHATMEKDESGRIKVEYSSEVPSGSGLGTSGALNVGLIATILGHNKSLFVGAKGGGCSGFEGILYPTDDLPTQND